MKNFAVFLHVASCFAFLHHILCSQSTDVATNIQLYQKEKKNKSLASRMFILLLTKPKVMNKP